MVILLKVIPEHFPVHITNRVEYNVAMKMVFIEMRANSAFVFISKIFLSELTADTKALFWRYLPGFEALDEVIPLHIA